MGKQFTKIKNMEAYKTAFQEVGFIKLFNIINVHHFNNTKRNEAKINGRWKNVCAVVGVSVCGGMRCNTAFHPFARGVIFEKAGVVMLYASPPRGLVSAFPFRVIL